MRKAQLLGLSALVVTAAVLVSTLSQPEADATPLPAASAFSVDAVHSALIFKVSYGGLSSFYGRFNEFSGSFHVDEADLSKSKFDITVKASSVDSGNGKRDNHLRAPDFFSAKQYPEIRFVSKSVKVKGKELDVTGELSFRGVKKDVQCKVTYGGQKKGRRGGMRAGFDGTMTIKREDFGVTFGKGHLGSDVTIQMGLTGTSK
ncbi:MAG: YceI family protein [Planctomycetota bacterium]